MKKLIMMTGLILLAGLACAEKRVLTGTFQGVPGKWCSVKTDDAKTVSLGRHSEDGTTVSLGGGANKFEIDISGIAFGDRITVVEEGTVDENGNFKREKLISIEKQ